MSELLELIHTSFDKHWAERAEELLQAFARNRYGARWEKSMQVRVNGETAEGAAPYCGFIPAGQPRSGGYGGMSLVLFPAPEEPALVTLCVGTNGLAPDEQALGRPGHARKVAAIARWLNARSKRYAAWAKRDPVRIDLGLPQIERSRLQGWDSTLKKYGRVIYATFVPSPRGAGGDEITVAAAHAWADLFAEEREVEPLTAKKGEKQAARSQWFSHAVPSVEQDFIEALLRKRRFVVLEGPPGTGKTRAAREILKRAFDGFGRTIQFHPTTTYETFVGGLAPVQAEGDIGLRFKPRPGHLLEAIAEAKRAPERPYLLHIDEINRADLSKVLGEAIYLFEPDDPEREIDLAYDFGPLLGRSIRLPKNLHVVGTMNSADRSIAILDVAVRRRFAFVSMWPSRRALDEQDVSNRAKESFEKLTTLFLEEAGEDALALMPGHAYFLDGGRHTDMYLKAGLKPLLQEYLLQGYVAGFADQVRAYLDWLDAPEG